MSHRTSSSVRATSSSVGAIMCDISTVRIEEDARKKLAVICKYYKSFSDMSRPEIEGDGPATFGGGIYDENDILWKHHQATMPWISDKVLLEMDALLKTAGWVADNYPVVKDLLSVTDSEQGYNRLNQLSVVLEGHKAYELYEKKKLDVAKLRKRFDTFEFGWVSRKNKSLKRVDRVAVKLRKSHSRPEQAKQQQAGKNWQWVVKN